MPVISLPSQAMGPFGMPMVPGNGSSGGGGDTTFSGKALTQNGNPYVFDGPDSDSAVDTMTGIIWIDNGNKFIASIQTSGSNNSYGLYEFVTTTPYSTLPSDISYNNVNFLTYNEIADADFSPLSITFNGDGTVGYFGEDNEIFGFTMTTAYDLSTATGTGHTKTSIPNAGAPYGYGAMKDLRFNNNGTKMFVVEVSGNDCAILEFSLSTAYDVTTRSASATATFDPTTASNGGGILNAIEFSADGKKMYGLGPGGLGGVRFLYEYDLSTGFDISTMSYNNERVDLETLAGIDLAQSLTFNNDFSKLYIADGNDGLFQFNWGTPSGNGVSREFTGETGNNITYSNASTGGTGDFTFEIFVNLDTVSSNQTLATMGDTSVRYSAVGNEVQLYNPNGAKAFANSTLVADNTFDHLAVVRNGADVKLFVNGSQADAGTMDKSITGDVVIGSKADGNEPVNGTMYGLRVAREQIYTSTFAPPTTALVETPNTDLLTLQTAVLPPAKNGASPTITGTVPTASANPIVSGGNVQSQASTFTGGISENAPGAGGAAGSAYAMTGSGLTGNFAGIERLKTNGTYTIVGDSGLTIRHTGTGTTGSNKDVYQAGWAWIIRNSDGAIMKSWNGMLNGDHGDSSLATETDTTLNTTSKFINCQWTYACGINDNYCFIGVPYRPVNTNSGPISNNNFTQQRAYLFAYKLSDFSLAKVWKVNDFASQIEPYSNSPMASSFGSAFLETGMEVTNDGLYIGSYRTKSTFGNVDGGAFSYFDISDADPANWSSTPTTVVKNPINVVSNPTTTIGASNFSNGDFGKGIKVSQSHPSNVLVVNHPAWMHRYTRNGSNFTRTGQVNPNPAVYDGGYTDISSDGKTYYVTDTTGGSQHVDALDLDNNFTNKWTYNFTTNGSPGYYPQVYRHGGQDYILVGDGYDDTDGTDAGKLVIIKSDGTELKIVDNPTPNNQKFGYISNIGGGSYVTRVQPGGSSYALQFMNGTSLFDAVQNASGTYLNGWTVRSDYSGMSNERYYSIGSDSTYNNFYAAGYDAVDDTVLTASFDTFGTYRWSYIAGPSGRLYDTAVDTSGNMIAVGYKNVSTPLLGMVVKHASDGTLTWNKSLNTSGDWIGLAVATDSSDNIYVAGRTDHQSNSGNPNPFVVKLNSSGAVQWAKKYDHGGQQSQPEGIAVDGNGDIIVSGRIHEQITGGGYSCGMVMKISSSDGSLTWHKFFKDPTNGNGYHTDQFQNVAITPENDILTCGWTNYQYAGTYHGVVLKLSGVNGSQIWQRRTIEDDGTKKIAVDSTGKIYVFSDSEVLFVYTSDGTLQQEWKIDATGSDNYYIEDVFIDKNDNAILAGFWYTSGGNPAQPFITKLPATIQAGTSGDFEITAQTKGDAVGILTNTTFTSYSSNTISGATTSNTTGMTPSSISATHTLNAVAGASSGGGGAAGPQGWITTITDEISGYGYPDAQFQSLDVDSNDNIYIGGDSGTNWQIVVKMLSDGTVDSAAYFGGSGATNNHRAIAVASDGSIFVAGEAKDVWNRTDGHTMRLTTSLTKSYDTFFGEGYNDEHFDITTDGNGNAFAVGEAQSYSAAFSQDPKGYLVKYDSSGGVARTQISTSFQRSYPQGVSSDGTNVYVIAKDQNHMFIAKVNSALSSVTWSKNWGSNSAEPRIMDIDTNSSGESAALMYESNKWRLAKIDASGNATWRITWEKASTDHGAAYPGYNFSAGYAVKLLASGSIAVLAGHMPWTTQSYKKSLYIVVFDSTGSATVQKEFRLTNSSHYLGNIKKSLAELSDGKIVIAASYYRGSNSASSAWASSVFKFDPTDTSTAINGVHGDWEISDITDSTVGTDSTTYTSGSSASLNTNMSMYFKNGYQGATSGFSSGSATMTTETKTTLNYTSGSATPSGVLFNTTGTHTWTVPDNVTTISIVAVGGGGGGYGYWNVDATQLRIGTGGDGGHLVYANNIYVTPGETLDVTVGAGGAKGNQFGGAYGGVSYSAQPGVSSKIERSGTILVQAKGGNAIGNGNSDTNIGLAGYSGGSGGGHGSTVTGGGGGGGAGGYSGTGGSGGSDQFNPWSPTAPGGSGSGGGGSGGRGAGGQTSTGQGGGGVGLYGEGSSGTGGQGAGGSGGTNGTSSAGGVYGGGGGAGYTSVVGAQGGIRIIWGDANTSRTFPSTNVDQASSTAAETTV